MTRLRELYRPSCGSEGADFISSWCCGCERDKNEDCQIVADTFMYDTDEPEYPQQWVYGDKGPECTAWIALGDPFADAEMRSHYRHVQRAGSGIGDAAMTGPQPCRDYPPAPGLAERLLTMVADLAVTCGIVALAYGFAVGLAELMF